jgi:helicase MOV-10
MHGINIGPLEAFQGLESRLVILCTTRTRNRFIDQDVARGLGVIYEPKRFNVALTRAKQGLIVIGNADVLDQDENWVAFLAFCKRNHAWKGESAWMPPHSSRIRRSRLEKRWEIQKSVRDAEQTSGKLGLGSNSTIDDVMWTKGIAAEDAVLRVEELSTEAHMEK